MDSNAKFIFDFIQNHPEYNEAIKSFCESLLSNETKSICKDDALRLYVNNDLTKQQYIDIRSTVNEIASDLLPSYYQIQLAKQDCYPPSESIIVSEVQVKIRLQDILDLTVSRILKMTSINTEESHKYTLILKWGCDGASSQATYKHSFSDPGFDDSSVFMCSFVPIKLYDVDTESVIWQNPATSSSRYCRPILFRFEKENERLTKECYNDIREQITSLEPFKINNNNTVDYKLHFTMVDTKICNDLTDNKSAMKCFICGANQLSMNKLDLINTKPPNEEHFGYGASSLHAWIRSFECILHIAYNLPFKSWSVRGDENKKIKEERKQQIQQDFRRELGLLVDFVKQGSGKTNDGNTARAFFTNYKISARITGINEQLIKRFYIILQTISSGYDVKHRII
ncbi:uncharacterized protein LOC114356509 [Ostrinia furnacalis]|uniref:uncharacterized protein LOC114356509 n=1 Tax=Ostrinia furnacalis TaxID=93504 RepID=UPI001039068A|nr:uncharacterized protein LOC114356509 [Ostrinia furnacalis]